jgi:hypothetical protein
MRENCLGGPVESSRVPSSGPGAGGVGGEMASSETEASPPSRRRPPPSGRYDPQSGRNWTSSRYCNTFMITLLAPLGANRTAEADTAA